MTFSTNVASGQTIPLSQLRPCLTQGNGECGACTVSSPPAGSLRVGPHLRHWWDPTRLHETLRAADEDRYRERPELEKEARMLSAEMGAGRAESRKLVAALAAGGHMPSVTGRLGVLDHLPA